MKSSAWFKSKTAAAKNPELSSETARLSALLKHRGPNEGPGSGVREVEAVPRYEPQSPPGELYLARTGKGNLTVNVIKDCVVAPNFAIYRALIASKMRFQMLGLPQKKA